MIFVAVHWERAGCAAAAAPAGFATGGAAGVVEDWPSYGGTPAGHCSSVAGQLTPANAAGLQMGSRFDPRVPHRAIEQLFSVAYRSG
jgi:hypothetical protein